MLFQRVLGPIDLLVFVDNSSGRCDILPAQRVDRLIDCGDDYLAESSKFRVQRFELLKIVFAEDSVRAVASCASYSLPAWLYLQICRYDVVGRCACLLYHLDPATVRRQRAPLALPAIHAVAAAIGL
jgi:hypothetical protein